MKKLTLLAALVCGVSFSSMAAEDRIGIKPETYTISELSDELKEISFSYHIDNETWWNFDFCGHHDRLWGDKAAAAEYAAILIAKYC